jgi:hypothetical protein
MTRANESSAKSVRKNPVGKHRARTFIDRLLRADERACRRGHHRYSAPTPIGGGIQRSACSVCGSVSIDLRDVPVPPRPTRLFRHAGIRRRG